MQDERRTKKQLVRELRTLRAKLERLEKSDDDAIDGVQIISQDIAERKRAEEKLRQQLNELRRWQEVTLGREDRVRQLKTEVNQLLVQHGETIRYHSQEGASDKQETAKG